MSFTLSLGPVANMQTITAAWSTLTEAMEAHAALVLTRPTLPMST
jgi:hypothetical protein